MMTRKAPVGSIASFKRTKIVATVGPAVNSYDQIKALLESGVNGFRFNFSHISEYEECLRQIKWIRRASRAYGKPVAIIQDLQGPKVRLGDFDGMISIARGQELEFAYKVDYVEGGPIPTQYDLSTKAKRGEELLLFDGRVRCTITSVRKGVVSARAENSGFVVQRKGINLPDTDFGGDIITAKDRKDITFGAEQDFDFVALSFVQSAKDIQSLRRLLSNRNSPARIICKVETRASIENIEEIVDASDAVMVARGDLGVEVMPESVPVLQRKIIGLCRQYGKTSIVATQMLASMMETPEPTRAEVSDVATAVIVGADAVMLSDETAVGKYPAQAVQMMKRIILYTQTNSPLKPIFYKEEDTSIQSAISSAIITLAHQVGAKAIVAETASGQTARSIAAHRPEMPIIMVTSTDRVAQQLALVYGGKSYVRPDSPVAGIRLTSWLRQHNVFKKGDVVVICSGKYPGKVGSTDTIKVRKIET